MGVQGLMKHVEEKGRFQSINIADEITEWKKQNAGRRPLIVIDYMSIGFKQSNRQEVVCGGRHSANLKSWEAILKVFKFHGCQLVFFIDLQYDESKIDEKLRRHNDRYKTYSKLYDAIERGQTLNQISRKDYGAITSTLFRRVQVTRKYGEVRFAVTCECDTAVAQYATEHNALAVISEDSDFMIFDGLWQLWSSQKLRLDRSQLKTIAFPRDRITDILSLARNQLPLFATLVGNDFTKTKTENTKNSNRIGEMATFVRAIECTNLTDADIERISIEIRGRVDSQYQWLIKESLGSYDIKVPAPPLDDPIAKKLQTTDMFRPYMQNMKQIHGITMPYYDMRQGDSDAKFSKLLIEWKKRCVGILRQRFNDDKYKLTLLAKKSIDEKFMAHVEPPIYPDFGVPPLEQLYLGGNPKIEEEKWTIFGWLVSIPADICSVIKKLPHGYRLVCTILYVLVKNGIVSVLEADALLYTEWKVLNGGTRDTKKPKHLVARHVNVAQIYNVSYQELKEKYAIAGLLKFAADPLLFDGVYFQTKMKEIADMNTAEPKSFIKPIEKYRIYVK